MHLLVVYGATTVVCGLSELVIGLYNTMTDEGGLDSFPVLSLSM